LAVALTSTVSVVRIAILAVLIGRIAAAAPHVVLALSHALAISVVVRAPIDLPVDAAILPVELRRAGRASEAGGDEQRDRNKADCPQHCCSPSARCRTPHPSPGSTRAVPTRFVNFSRKTVGHL